MRPKFAAPATPSPGSDAIIKVGKCDAISAEGRRALEEARAKIGELVGEVVEGHGPAFLPDPDAADGWAKA